MSLVRPTRAETGWDDTVQHPVRGVEYLLVAQADQFVTTLWQTRGPRGMVFGLRVVDVSLALRYREERGTTEVYDARTDGMLW